MATQQGPSTHQGEEGHKPKGMTNPDDTQPNSTTFDIESAMGNLSVNDRAVLQQHDLPSLIISNMNSVVKKIEELKRLVKEEVEFRECSLMCFTETWLRECHTLTIQGFQTFRADRMLDEVGKKRGGGLAVLVNNRWCNPRHITERKRICQTDIELLALELDPYRVPQEMSHVFMVVVYIKCNAKRAIVHDVIRETIDELKTGHPSALILITGDFNRVNMEETLTAFTQYVDIPTRKEQTLDLLFANLKDAYDAKSLRPLGKADHIPVHLTPRKKIPATTNTKTKPAKKSLWICSCGWYSIKTFDGLKIHQKKNGCIQGGVNIPLAIFLQLIGSNSFRYVEALAVSSDAQTFDNQASAATTDQTGSETPIKGPLGATNAQRRLFPSPDEKPKTKPARKSVWICSCGWHEHTTYDGLKIHQDMNGCTQVDPAVDSLS